MITRKARLKIPVSLVNNIDAMLEALRVPNPERESAAVYGTPYGLSKIPEYLTFFTTEEATKSVYVPRNIPTEWLKEGVSVVDNTSPGRSIKLELSPGFQLRNYQEKFLHEKILPAIEFSNDVTLVMPCGHGKTIQSLVLAHYYKRNTLVTVTTDSLAQQWRKAIARLFPDATVSIFSDKKGVDADFVIATYSMMSQPEYDEGWFSQFGHYIADEVHRIGASTWHSILDKASCRYRTTLTATFRRKDGLHEILRKHCGQICTLPRQMRGATVLPLLTGTTANLDEFRNVEKKAIPRDKMEPFTEAVLVRGEEQFSGMIADVHKDIDPETLKDIIKVKFKIQHGKLIQVEEADKIYRRGMVSMPKLDTAIAEEPKRRNLTIRALKLCLQARRKILLLAKRKELLFSLSDVFTKAFSVKNGVLTSNKNPEQKEFAKARGMTVHELEEWCAAEADLILGIDKLAAEGLDIESLDTLVLTYPSSDIEQEAGRILRLMPGKKDPFIIYMVDDIPAFRSSWEKAKAMFEELGHEVMQPMTLENFEKQFFQ